MSTNKPPAFQFYPSDWLADAKVQSLTAAQEGIYIRLLCYCWREGSLPANGSAIAQLCKREVTELDIDHVLKTFFSERDGNYYNKRLDKERQKQISFAKERSKSGKLGAEKRWQKDDSSAIAEPLAQPMAKNSSSSSSTSTSTDLIEREAQALPPTGQDSILPAIVKPKTSIFKPNLITRDQYQAMLNDEALANGDREYLKKQVLTMADWSASGSKRKTDWAATLRNWIRRSRDNGQMPSGITKTNGPKCFAQLEQEWGDNQLAEFLKRQKEKVIHHVEN